MSRIGKLPITIPSGVKVVVEPKEVRLEGPKGKLKTTIPPGVNVKVEGPIVRVEREGEQRHLRALHGLTRKLIANMAQGVSQGFSRVLEINGVGYRAEVKGQEIHITLGFSHPVVFPAPRCGRFRGETGDRNTQQCGSSVARRDRRETTWPQTPEPYKGKGVKYREEVIRRKAGKAVGSAGSA